MSKTSYFRHFLHTNTLKIESKGDWYEKETGQPSSHTGRTVK